MTPSKSRIAADFPFNLLTIHSLPEARPRSPIRMRSDRTYLRAKAVWLGMVLDASRVKRLDKHALELAKMDFENAKLELEE